MISKKQRKILAFPYTKFDALICDGAIRSGKTSIMTVAFVDWAMREFDRCNFAVCGKTVGSAIKNIIVPYISMDYSKKYDINFTRSDNKMVVRQGTKTNTFYIYGGKDESSYMLIQGITLAGVLLDEVALMTRSFVEQALARCSVNGSKYWFNCNPASPQHWFYTEWILKSKDKNALHLHFDLRDNPALTEKIIQRYENTYTGVFYDRYILGKWVVAEGLVYDCWKDDYIIEDLALPEWHTWYISMDYGTVNPCSMGLWCISEDMAIRIAEYYYDSRKEGSSRTDEEHYTELEKLAAQAGSDIQSVIIDPSAASFIECIRRHGKFNVRRADNDVINGINRTSTLIKSGHIRVHESCKGFLREIALYSWDEKSTKDTVVKENDHAMDDMRYLVNTILRKTLLRNLGG